MFFLGGCNDVGSILLPLSLTHMHTILLLFFFLVTMLTGSHSAFATEDQGCTSTKCHPSMAAAEKTHPPGVECSVCHLSIKNPHPDGNGRNFTANSDICITCHDTIVDYDFLHSPVASGECHVCHSPHGSAENKYFHEQEKIICYNCHAAVTEADDKFFHGEVKNNKCASCHTVHGSFAPNLLRENYSTYFLNDYQEKHYELCFSCHKTDLLLYPRTSYNTKFRDGKNNLHFVHVNRVIKGRSCKSCHATHSAKLPHLMADFVSFGNWPMPINFEKNEDGGKCAPGCHVPLEYSREIRRQ